MNSKLSRLLPIGRFFEIGEKPDHDRSEHSLRQGSFHTRDQVGFFSDRIESLGLRILHGTAYRGRDILRSHGALSSIGAHLGDQSFEVVSVGMRDPLNQPHGHSKRFRGDRAGHNRARMHPKGFHLRRSDSIRPSSANLLAAYAPFSGSPTRPPREQIDTILPRPRIRISGRSALVIRTTPRELVST